MGLQALPVEIFDLIIEQLVIMIGIQKAVLLRIVNQAFDAAILQAICVSQVVDIDDPATPELASRMVPTLLGKIIAVKSRTANVTSKSYLSVVAEVNRTLDTLISEADSSIVEARHEAIAGAVILIEHGLVDAQIEAQNLLSGAAIVGSISVLRSLLEHDKSLPAVADANGKTPYFYPPLTLAAARGHYKVVRYLLDYGARLDVVSSNRHEYRDSLEQADWNSLSEGARSSVLRREPPTALCAAVLGGYGDIVHLLLRPQYRLPTTSPEYLRAVLAGAKAGRLDLVKVLFEAIGKGLSEYTGLGREMIRAATRSGQKDMVQWLLNNGVDINAYLYPGCYNYHGTLQSAASLGNISMVRFLIERGADVNFGELGERENLPIAGASRCGQEEVVELLIEHSADPVEAFRNAAREGHPRVLKFLLSRFPDLPYREGGSIGLLALYQAMVAGNLASITILVTAGVPLNDGSDPDLPLPLDLATTEGLGPWVINHLISLGAQGTGKEAKTGTDERTVRRVLVTERTWEWVSKY